MILLSVWPSTSNVARLLAPSFQAYRIFYLFFFLPTRAKRPLSELVDQTIYWVSSPYWLLSASGSTSLHDRKDWSHDIALTDIFPSAASASISWLLRLSLREDSRHNRKALCKTCLIKINLLEKSGWRVNRAFTALWFTTGVIMALISSNLIKVMKVTKEKDMKRGEW